MPLREYLVWTDGACANNGAYENGRYERYGVIPEGSIGVHSEQGDISARLPDSMRPHTNNKSELYAILVALENAPSRRPIILYTDSMHCVNIINGWADKWRDNGGLTNSGQEPANWDLILDVMQEITNRRGVGQTVDVIHVRGHANNAGNQRANDLAQQALRGVRT